LQLHQEKNDVCPGWQRCRIQPGGRLEGSERTLAVARELATFTQKKMELWLIRLARERCY
jgi:hypothetical protein